jgi:flagellar basal-body rod modification protein FlgD
MSSIPSYNSNFANDYFKQKTQEVTEVSSDPSKNNIEVEEKSVFGTNDDLGKQQFLELLVTQLRYQDPLNPSNDQEFIAQLAQFSSLESSQNIESGMDDMANSMKGFVEAQDKTVQDLSNSSAAGLLGKHALVEKEEFYFDGTEEAIPIYKESNGTSLINVTNQQGDVVYSEPVTGQGGYMEFTWDGGTGNPGERAKSGSYKISVTDLSNSKEEGFAFVEDYISAITYDEGTAKITVNGNSYRLEDIKQIVEVSE